MTFDLWLIHRYTHTFKHHPGCYWCGLPDPVAQFMESRRGYRRPPADPDDPFRVIEQIRLSRARAL